MPLAKRLLREFVNGAWFAILLTVLGSTQIAHAALMLDQATATFELPPGAESRGPASITLPFDWSKQLGGVGGKAHLVIQFPAAPNGPQQALFVRRIGSSFEIAVNGQLLAKEGVHGDSNTDTSTRPKLFIIPANLLRADNTIAITIGAARGRQVGMGVLYAGPVDEMRSMQKEAYLWRNRSYQVLLVISALLGGFGFLLWWRLRDAMYLYYALSEVMWAVHLADIQFTTDPLPYPWWGIISFSCYAAAAGFICKFALTLVQKNEGWINRLSEIQLWLSLPVVAFAFLVNSPMVLTTWLKLTLLLCSAVAVLVIQKGVRSGSAEQRVLAVAIGVTCIVSLRDLLVFQIWPGYGGYPWVGFAWVAFAIAIAGIFAERLRKSTHSLAAMNRNLAQRLAQREQELGAIYDAQLSQDRNQAVTEERQRIMRDMHDGLGSQLVSAVHLVNDPSVPRGMLVEQLQNALDNLKLTVDAMQDTDGDIAVLLGTLRYRLTPRFAAAGIALSWDVLPLPFVENWTIQKSRHLQLILFEAISNLITHAKATQAHLSAEYRDGENGEEIGISLSDNGSGFQIDTLSIAGGHGLENIRARAASIGATLQIFSSADGTQLNLTIPVRAC